MNRALAGGVALLLSAACGHGQVQPLPRAQYAIRAARLLDPRTGRYSGPVIVLVDRGRIRDVLPAEKLSTALADTIIRLDSLTLLPGLIDSHVHLTLGGPFRRNASAVLRAGFTTVVDLGAVSTRVLRLRDSVSAGLIEGPRILGAGLWIGTKGGTCEFNGIGVAGGATEFRARVRENIEAGADVIKLCLSGWPALAFLQPDLFEIPEPVIAAAVEEAHARHRLVVAHDLSLGGVKAALRTGVDGLVHAAFLDSATALRLKQRGVFLIPTLASLVDTSQAGRALVDAVALAYHTGVPIVFGTDAGVLPHGRNAEEFLALGRSGMTRLDAIRSATVSAAAAWQLGDSVGVVSPGGVADLIAVGGDPLADLKALQQVRFVMARGKIVTP